MIRLCLFSLLERIYGFIACTTSMFVLKPLVSLLASRLSRIYTPFRYLCAASFQGVHHGLLFGPRASYCRCITLAFCIALAFLA